MVYGLLRMDAGLLEGSYCNRRTRWTGPILFLTRWVIFQRQHKIASHAAKACPGENMLQITSTTSFSLSPHWDMTGTRKPEPFQMQNIHCLVRSSAKFHPNPQLRKQIWASPPIYFSINFTIHRFSFLKSHYWLLWKSGSEPFLGNYWTTFQVKGWYGRDYNKTHGNVDKWSDLRYDEFLQNWTNLI